MSVQWLLLLLSGVHSQLQGSFGSSESCNSSSTACYRGGIWLCVDNQPSTLVHACMNGCTACPVGPHICNDEKNNSRCSQATPDRFSTACTSELQGKSFCLGGDVRFCNSSNLAVLLEYCDSRGCQSDPLSCHSPAMRPIPAPIVGKGKKGKAKGKKATPTPILDTTHPAAGASNCSDGKRVRVEWASMPDVDRERYVKAVLALYANGDVQKLAQLHFESRDQIHGSGVLHFLVWHRVFLNDFEEKLRALPGFACVTVPFWTYDYSTMPTDRRSLFGTTTSRLGQADHEGCIGGAFASATHTLNGSTTPTCIMRKPDSALLGSLSNAVFTDLTQLSDPNFASFSDSFQNAHGLPHVAVGGFLSTYFSPIDPAFFVHHANIDRLWSIWQDCHQNYEWSEPQGLKQPIFSYVGVTAGDVIDSKKYVWKGKTQSVEYASNGLGNPSQYSSDFRQRIVTSCQGGGLEGALAQVTPVIGVDDSWATRSGGGVPVVPQTRDVVLTCTTDTGTTDLGRLPMPAVAVYDNLLFQDCVSRCGTFYFKNNGPSNCVCISMSSGSGISAVNLDAVVNRFVASCGSGSSYGLYQPGASGNRRLLQIMQQPEMMMPNEDTTSLPTNAEGSNSMQGSESTPMGGSTFAMGGSTSSPMGGSTSSMADGSTASMGGSTSSMMGGNTLGGSTFMMGGNTSSMGGSASGGNTSSMGGRNTSAMGESTPPMGGSNASVIGNSSVGSNSASNNTNANVTNAARESNSTNMNSTNLNSTNANSTNSNASRVCFSAFAPPTETRVERACSSAASTPPPLPLSWMLMNHLNPDNADTCKLFKPATGSRSIDCFQNPN